MDSIDDLENVEPPARWWREVTQQVEEHGCVEIRIYGPTSMTGGMESYDYTVWRTVEADDLTGGLQRDIYNDLSTVTGPRAVGIVPAEE